MTAITLLLDGLPPVNGVTAGAHAGVVAEPTGVEVPVPLLLQALAVIAAEAVIIASHVRGRRPSVCGHPAYGKAL